MRPPAGVRPDHRAAGGVDPCQRRRGGARTGPDLTIEEIRTERAHVRRRHRDGRPGPTASPPSAWRRGPASASSPGTRGAGGQRASPRWSTTVRRPCRPTRGRLRPGSSDDANPTPSCGGLDALYRIYDAADGWVFLAAPRSTEWQALVRRDSPTCRPGSRRSVRHRGSSSRDNDDALVDVLAGTFARPARTSWERELLAAGVVCVAVSTAPVRASSCRATKVGRASGWVTEVVHPTFDAIPPPRAAGPLLALGDPGQARGACGVGHRCGAPRARL